MCLNWKQVCVLIFILLIKIILPQNLKRPSIVLCCQVFLMFIVCSTFWTYCRHLCSWKSCRNWSLWNIQGLILLRNLCGPNRLHECWSRLSRVLRWLLTLWVVWTSIPKQQQNELLVLRNQRKIVLQYQGKDLILMWRWWATFWGRFPWFWLHMMKFYQRQVSIYLEIYSY